jgi:hypothetical protein
MSLFSRLVYSVVAGADKATPAKSALRMMFLGYILDDMKRAGKFISECSSERRMIGKRYMADFELE